MKSKLAPINGIIQHYYGKELRTLGNAYEVLFHKWVQFGRFIKAAAAAAGIIVYSKPDVEHLNESHGRFGPHDQNQQY